MSVGVPVVLYFLIGHSALISVDSTVCDLIVTLQLRVDNSRILVADDYANDDQVVQKVSHVMGAICQWKKWWDSGWVTIGDTSRSFLGALLLGIADFIAFAIQHGHSAYHLSNEFRQVVHRAEKCFSVQVSVVSFVSDAVLGMLQIACHVAGDEPEIQCEMACISDLPKFVWEIIGLVLGLRPVGSRSAAVAGALSSSCELLLQKTLWPLSVDCYEGKLQAFFLSCQPADLVPWKLHQLGRVEFSLQELLQGFHLLRNLVWSQVSTEQGHSAASVVMKEHRTLGHQMPQTRSMLGQMRCLCAEPAEVRTLSQVS